MLCQTQRVHTIKYTYISSQHLILFGFQFNLITLKEIKTNANHNIDLRSAKWMQFNFKELRQFTIPFTSLSHFKSSILGVTLGHLRYALFSLDITLYIMYI